MFISEMFYSLQGEGPSMGRPAIFVRTSGCNLSCKWCDTKDVMDMKRTHSVTPEAVADLVADWLRLNPTALLVFTGGEPLLHEHDIHAVLQYIQKDKKCVYWIEVETNGTMFPSVLHEYVNQFNVSPKFESAFAGKKFYRPDIINRYVDLAENKGVKVAFKFVIKNKQDIDEFYGLYRDLIPKYLVWLMPNGSTKEELSESYPIVAEFAKDLGYNFSPRLHIDIWNGKKGV